MNWKTFTAMLSRDAHVARRNAVTMFLQILLQPLLFVFIFGQVMVRSGMMPSVYKSMLLPGIMALLTKEIEDRLLAPIDTKWLAVEKVVFGMVQSLIAGSVVLPAAWLLMGRNIGLSFDRPVEFAVIMLLVAVLAA